MQNVIIIQINKSKNKFYAINVAILIEKWLLNLCFIVKNKKVYSSC